MPGHGALVENVTGSIAGLLGAEANVPKNPEFLHLDSIIEPSSWRKLPFPYTFAIVDIGTGVEADGFTDFPLPISPQSLNQTEEFAIVIQPTFGGTTVTHSGNRYKTLSIKGTTGVHAFRGTGGVLKSTGEAIFQPKELKYKSGYEVFLRLRNWFRAYYEVKKSGTEEVRDFRLVFKNYKDGEFLIVECTKFEMIRQAARPFLYDYDFEFKVLANLFDGNLRSELAGEESKFAAAVELLDQAMGTLLRVQGILRQVEATYDVIVLNPLRKINRILKTAIALPEVAGDIAKRMIANTISTVEAIGITTGIIEEQQANKVTGSLDPRIAAIQTPADPKSVIELEGPGFINSFNEGLMALEVSRFPPALQAAMAEEQEDLRRTPRAFFEDTLAEITRVKENAEDFLNLGDPTFDALFERTATLVADPTKVATVEEFETLAALNDAIQAINLVLSTNSLFKSSLADRLEVLENPFNGALALSDTPAVKQIILQAGVSLEKLAQIYLRDSTRWGEIAELNELRAPYIVADLSSTLVGVAKPGDRILIPTSIVNGFSQVPQGKQTPQNVDLSEVEKSLGTDLRLTKDFDIALTAGGDFALISGVDNMIQATHLKLGYERGEVIRFPQIGAGIVVGTKFPTLQTIQNGVVNTLLQDARVERLEGLSLRRRGSELELSFNLKIRSIDLPVPLTIKLS